jgi:hypothetical protein
MEKKTAASAENVNLRHVLFLKVVGKASYQEIETIMQ